MISPACMAAAVYSHRTADNPYRKGTITDSSNPWPWQSMQDLPLPLEETWLRQSSFNYRFDSHIEWRILLTCLRF